MWVFAQHRKDLGGLIREDGGKEAGARRALPLGPGLQNSFRVTQCLKWRAVQISHFAFVWKIAPYHSACGPLI
jgi:hypothetical protein